MVEQTSDRQIKARLTKCLSAIVLCLSLCFGWTNFVLADELSEHQNHVLSRLTFGITAWETEQLEENGLEAYIQSQLKPETIEESSALNNYLAGLESLDKNPVEQQRKQSSFYQEIRKDSLSPEQKQQVRKNLRKLRNGAINEAANAHVARTIYSHRQLQEVMVDFWFNHFNVSAEKRAVRFWVNDYENQIRDRALGNFSDLLLATARHPAMLMYLDNYTNTAPESQAGKRRNMGLNENYARELMELHTLGVDGGYSQEDVISLARVFTGWGINHGGKNQDNDMQNGFVFYPNRHDPNNKTFLGYEIAGNGVEEGKQVIEILANHPATARFISYKLAQYFVADLPPESLVERLSKAFLNSQGNITMVLDTLIHSPEFNDLEYHRQKFKTPYQYFVSLVRIGEIEQPDINRVKGMIEQLSMPVYKCSTPDGYANTKSAWVNPQAILQRTSFATAIANGRLNQQSPIEIQRVEQNLGEISTDTREVIATTPPKLHGALVMGSPEAMYR